MRFRQSKTRLFGTHNGKIKIAEVSAIYHLHKFPLKVVLSLKVLKIVFVFIIVKVVVHFFVQKHIIV